jgi:AAA ATPase domain/PIN domain
VTSTGYERLLAAAALTGTDIGTQRTLTGMVSLEIDQRDKALEATISALRAQIGRWPLTHAFAVPDTSFYVEHEDKLEEADFQSLLALRGMPVHVIVPIAVVDELDGLKKSKDPRTRWRAGYTLAVLDRVLAGDPAATGRLQAHDLTQLSEGGTPSGDVTIEIVFDPPCHVRLTISDDEIIDRILAVEPLAGRRVTLLTYDLSVKLSLHPPEDGAAAPLNEGPILFVRVENHRHRATVPFDDRSRGFVWFFSFLAYFGKIEEGRTSNLILLLDEPGLSLHARAQKDLLRLIDERLAPRHQVIYTTHSPFMVSPGQFHRVRTVIDHLKGGSKVSAEIFKADDDTVSPLLTAMGIEMTQTLFIGEHTLLLEGPSDLIYLDILSDLTESRQLTGLDPRWVKTPIGGSGKLSTFVTLLGANKLHVAVLIDSSTKDTGAVNRLRDNGQLARNGLVEISEFTGTRDADIEDLFDRDFYLELVNRAYASELSQPITAADLTPGEPRIVRAIEAYFRQHGIASGKFNHYRPATVLLKEQATLVPRITDTTVNRAERLFVRLNAFAALTEPARESGAAG